MRIKKQPSLFSSFGEFRRTLDLCIETLQENNLPKDEEGFTTIENLCNEMKKKDKNLSYLNKNHIIELFIRDPKKRILISNENKIKYKNVKYVKPPEILYFGTVDSLVEKMKKNGLKSSTKGYIKLFSLPEDALEFAKKFLREGEKTTYLEIKAGEAFEEGVRFSTFKEGIYIVSKLDKKYIVQSTFFQPKQ